MEVSMNFELKQIGTIRTPYTDKATYQPVTNDKGEFRIVIDPSYADGLRDLELFHYIYVIYYMHRIKRKKSMTVIPPWTGDMKVGLFASRSPVRPNPIGLSIVRVKRIINNEIFTSCLDVFDGTPLIDIKPYIKDLDSKSDANYGWIEKLEDREHLSLHIKGVPHDY
jgi:tRNA-Thr(GGU) m(6)t(6)A37 methyltransferase TsaA